MSEQTILDMCCGSRMFWFNKRDTRTLFADIRSEEHELCDGRLVISPMPDYECGVMTQRECFQAGWEAHHAAMLRAGAPVHFGWSKGHFGYHTLFNAIGKAVNIQGGALSISVSAFEDAMLAAAPQQE
ncbi:hypothetical protein [Enterobacter sp. 276E10]|uniref:hypothetical protein n=1 Tax=Enterobacter TaxID=547 RepID=UPI002A82B646|nr:hypothetical protein [Enterobacter sp. 276E10]